MKAAKVKALHQGWIFIIIIFIIIVIIIQNVYWTTYFQQVHQIWVHNAQISECNHFLARFLVCWKDAAAVFLIPLWRDEKKVDFSCLIRSTVQGWGTGSETFPPSGRKFFFFLLSLCCAWPRYTDVLAAAEASPRHLQFTQRLTPDMTAGRQLWPHTGG